MPAFCFFLALGLGFSALLFWEATANLDRNGMGRGRLLDIAYVSAIIRNILHMPAA